MASSIPEEVNLDEYEVYPITLTFIFYSYLCSGPVTARISNLSPIFNSISEPHQISEITHWSLNIGNMHGRTLSLQGSKNAP